MVNMAHRKGEIMVAAKGEIARDFFEWSGGALVSVTQISRYFGYNRKKIGEIVKPLRQFGKGTGKRYFYKEVVEELFKQ